MPSSRNLQDVPLQSPDEENLDAGVLQLPPTRIPTDEGVGLSYADVDGLDTVPDGQDPVDAGRVSAQSVRAGLHCCIQRDGVGQRLGQLCSGGDAMFLGQLLYAALLGVCVSREL